MLYLKCKTFTQKTSVSLIIFVSYLKLLLSPKSLAIPLLEYKLHEKK